jgi:isoleucyl-tRNA synthetase
MAEYKNLESDPNIRESKVNEFWASEKIFDRQMEQHKDKDSYVWYEGPPTANGKPHFGHLIPRIYKDFFPRYKAMRGYYTPRKGGWDTHGLPVEIEVEKQLGINSKQGIEEYGVEAFIEKCKESVWAYIGDWQDMIRRMGFWVDLDNPYVTYHDEYIETGWWALKNLWEQDLLYKGYKVLPYCPRCGTSLSSHEVAQGYEEVKDPSVFVKMKLVDRENEYILAWTTTPWTLPGNVALAVGPDFDYAKVKQDGEIYYLAKDLVERVLEEDYEVLDILKGTEMDGWAYEPPFPYLKNALEARDELVPAWFVSADPDFFVTTEDGSGIVHTAVMYGEEDYQLGDKLGLPKLHTVDQAGNFIEEVEPWAGMFVKDADKLIIRAMKDSGALYKAEDYKHNYPFCWRCKTPLLYYALESWFVRTTGRQEQIIENNKSIQWHPEHMRDGRMGNFLETMKDWAISRNRYWGTPLPVWSCSEDHKVCIGSREQLVEMADDKELAKEVELHRPYIDNIKISCPTCSGAMERVPYVMDCWFDSGMMHSAQWHRPFENEELWESQFPADFICEGLDQTRGWFYTMLVSSTLLYPDRPFPHPYRHCLVTGLGLDKEGKKMSKSWGNVLDPFELMDEFGADALRWYLFSESAPWRDIRLSKDAVSRSLHSFMSTIMNVYNFFALYGNIDGFNIKEHYVELENRSVLDQWMISRFEHTSQIAAAALDDYDITTATQAVAALVEDLSNWYVRSSRPRFWGDELTEDKQKGYSTLHEVLHGLSRLLAPFTPFLAETLYHRLGSEPELSVHLCEFPTGNEGNLNQELELEMALARSVVSLGRQARQNSGHKVRQPLHHITIQHERVEFNTEIEALVKSELNIKGLEFTNENIRDANVTAKVEPDMAVVGPKYGDLAPKIRKSFENSSLWDDIASAIESGNSYTLDLDGASQELAKEDVKIKYVTKEGVAAAFDDEVFVMLDTEITTELRSEGYVRELVHHIQSLRKKAGFEVTDRIELFVSADPELAEAVAQYEEHVKAETLAIAYHTQEASPDAVDHVDVVEVNGLNASVGLKRQAS